ncbi:MAG: thioredoxin family protein [Clostridia bacterium]|nr:thioredoxin family protein [Clostridia bacterium]
MNYDLSGKCLIEITGEACDACLAVLPNCAAVAQKFALKFVKISVDDCPEAVQKFSIDRIPSIVIAGDGKIIAKCSGYQPLEILELWVEAKLGI